MHLPIFTVKITANKKGEITLIPSKTLEFYLREYGSLGEERFIEMLPHPRELTKGESPKRRWMCSCGVLHDSTIRVCGVCGDKKLKEGSRLCPCGETILSRGEKCEKCGGGYQTVTKSYTHIHSRFGIKPAKNYKEYLT